MSAEPDAAGPVRTRFAPSPTGELHLGNVRTAVLNWAFARHAGGRFVLRFEDTDVARTVERAEGVILEALDWLGLDRDEDPARGGPYGPYRQSERLERYRRAADRLLEQGAAFRCWCRPEELAARRKGEAEEGGYDGRCRDLSPEEEAAFRAEGRVPAVRFRVEAEPISFRDRVAGEVTIDGSDFGDFVILRSDGRPTYNFAVVLDDVEMEITHVIRGAGHLSNTPKQVLVYRALGASLPEFVHVPTVLAPGGGKLSKREGATGVLEYREQGYHPDAVVNYVSLLSWSMGEGEEVFSPAELTQRLDLDRLGGAEPILDPDKMRWLSGQHIRREPIPSLARRLAPYLDVERWKLDDRDLRAVAEVVRRRIHLFVEAREEAARLFEEPDWTAPDAEGALRASDAPRAIAIARDAWSRVEAWSPSALKKALAEASQACGLGGGTLFRPVRAALTGRLRGPELPEVAYVLGRERVLARLDRVLEVVRA